MLWLLVGLVDFQAAGCTSRKSTGRVVMVAWPRMWPRLLVVYGKETLWLVFPLFTIPKAIHHSFDLISSSLSSNISKL